VLRLLVAMDAAARWCDDPENHADLAAALAEPRLIGAPVDIIRHVLSGEFSLDAQGNRRVIDKYFTFHAQYAGYPRPSHALWIYSQMIRWGQVAYCEEGMAAAARAYRPDLYRTALGPEAAPADDDFRIEGDKPGDRFMDDHVFDPRKLEEYVRQFPVSSARIDRQSDGEQFD
jgi:two-component system, oxyanion-binding sensor